MRIANSRRVLLVTDALFGIGLIGAAFVGALASPRPQSPTAVPQPELVQRFGGIGPPGQAIGFSIGSDGTLGVVDRGRNLVLHLDADGRPLGEWGPRFGGDLEAQDLVGLAANQDGWYVLDRGAQRIVHLDATGQAEPWRTIDLQPLATYGPNGLAVDARGNVYVADTGRDRILVFDERGRPLNSIGDSGTDLGKLKQPMGLAFAPDGAMFVADWENNRVERFDAGGTATTVWPLPTHAWGLAVDRQGRVYAPDGDSKLVRAFSADGELLFELGSDPPLPVEFPSQVAVSPDGSSLWILGVDALARVDLRPFASVRGSDASATVRWPLAAAGLVLLAVAGIASTGRRLRRTPRPGMERPAAPRIEPSARLQSPPVGRSAPLLLGSGMVLFAIATLGAVVAGFRLAEPLAQADPWPRMALLTVSSLVWAIGVALTAYARPLHFVTAWTQYCADGGQRLRREYAIAGALGATVCAAVAGVMWWTQPFQTPEATRAALLWLLAIGIAIAVTARACTWRRHSLSVWTVIPWLLFGLALAPRLWNVADVPYGLWFDEAQAGLEARKFLAEGRYTPITDTFGRDASLFYYLISAASVVIHDPIAAGRTVAALVGAANAPLVYLLGRELLGWRVGLAGGVLLATSRWHLDVSRLGWDPIALPVCATLAFWLLARGVRTGRWTDLAWSGMAFGLGLHGYIGFRGLPFVAIVLLIYAVARQRRSVRRWLPGLFVFGACAVLVALPVLVFAVQDPQAFNGRINQTLIFAQSGSQAEKLDELWSNVQKHALMFHVRGDMNGRHNIPGWPMLDPFSGVLAMLGLAWLAVRLFDWRSWLVFGWSAVAMSGGILTLPFEAPQAMRTLAMTPVLAVLAALGLALLVDQFAVVTKPTAVRALAPLAALVVASIGILNVTQFFSRQMQDPTVWESFSTRETIPARAARASSGRFESILGSATIVPSVESQLLAPGMADRIRAFDATTDLPYRGYGPVLIVLETEHDAALADEVARYYPNAPREQITAPNAVKPLAEQFVLDTEMLAARRAVEATYRATDGSTVNRQEPRPELHPADLPKGLPVQVTWRMGLAIDVVGRYAFDVPPGFTLTIDGLQPGGPVELVRGNHLLELRGTLETAEPLRLDWQPPGVTAMQPIDRRAIYLPPSGGNGLAATYFPTLEWSGTPQEQAIEPLLSRYFHTSPFARQNFDLHGTWSAEWRGQLDVPASGTYRFEAERISRAGLWIDERLVFDDTRADVGDQPFGTVELSAGLHGLRVRFQDRSEGGPRIYLYWTPPGGARQIVPGRVLYPPNGQ